MICDLVGSTALSARLDPENMRAVIDAVTPLATTASSRNAPSRLRSPITTTPVAMPSRPNSSRPEIGREAHDAHRQNEPNERGSGNHMTQHSASLQFAP